MTFRCKCKKNYEYWNSLTMRNVLGIERNAKGVQIPIHETEWNPSKIGPINLRIFIQPAAPSTSQHTRHLEDPKKSLQSPSENQTVHDGKVKSMSQMELRITNTFHIEFRQVPIYHNTSLVNSVRIHLSAMFAPHSSWALHKQYEQNYVHSIHIPLAFDITSFVDTYRPSFAELLTNSPDGLSWFQ